MTYSPTQQVDQLLSSTIDWTHAPKTIQVAKKLCDQTLSAFYDAKASFEDAEVDKVNVDATWETDSKAAVRDGKPIPSSDVKETARFKLANAETDSRQAELANMKAINELAALVSDATLRGQWIANISTTLAKAQSSLLELMERVSPLLAEIDTDSSLQVFLGEYTMHPGMPRAINANPSAALVAYMTAQPWKPSEIHLDQVRYYVEPEPDTRPVVYLANSSKVNEYTAAEADEHLANQTERYRFATQAEISRYKFLNQ